MQQELARTDEDGKFADEDEIGDPRDALDRGHVEAALTRKEHEGRCECELNGQHCRLR